MRTTVKVSGLRELGEALQTLSSDVQKRVARSATAAGAAAIRKRAIQKAPVDTGNLRKNVIIKRIPDRESGLTSEHIVTVRSGKLTRKQKERGLKDAFYWRWVEFGTVKSPPQPFMRPAFDQGKSEAVEAITKRLSDRIARGK